ncbi:MAG: PAS domain S-box protein [Acidimicrobiia bacterium]|nr:PAS domain S-box protein [Acidimicrobiia bacterium]
MSDRVGKSRLVGLDEAASLLDLTADGVSALVQAGYLPAVTDPTDGDTTDGDTTLSPAGPRFAIGDLKAFVARNADSGAGNLFDTEGAPADPHALLTALDGRSEEMARRAFDIFATVFPEASSWGPTERTRFIEQARNRFEAILAVTGQGEEVDEALVGDLEEVGATAASTGSPLPQLLVVLRISRDLVVQTAVEVAEERGRHWGLALSLLLTRVLPAMDRLIDAVARGYWQTVVRREEESRTHYQHVVEHSSDGIFEVDLDGRVIFANSSLGVILGRSQENLVGAPLSDVLAPLEGANVLERLTVDTDEHDRTELAVSRPDGVRRVLEVSTSARREAGVAAGFQGVVRDVTAQRDLEESKNEFLGLITHDLRNPLTAILGLGATLETHADELATDRIQRMGQSVRRQAERISRLADDLFDVSRLEARSIVLNVRPVDLAMTVELALASVPDTAAVELHIAEGLTVLADGRRLEQVVANLIENALVHGAPPVVVAAMAANDEVVLSVQDHGPGIADSLLPTLFSRIRTLGRRDRDRARGTGLGLALVKGLVEAMGGRVWYDRAPGGGALFSLALPVPRART